MADPITLPDLQASLHDLLTEMAGDTPQALTPDILTYEKLAESLMAAGKAPSYSTVRRLMEKYEHSGRIEYVGKFTNSHGYIVKGWKRL